MDDNTLKAIECIAAAIGVPFTVWATLGGLAKTWTPDQYKVKMRTSRCLRASKDDQTGQPTWTTYKTYPAPNEEGAYADDDEHDEARKGEPV